MLRKKPLLLFVECTGEGEDQYVSVKIQDMPCGKAICLISRLATGQTWRGVRFLSAKDPRLDRIGHLIG